MSWQHDDAPRWQRALMNEVCDALRETEARTVDNAARRPDVAIAVMTCVARAVERAAKVSDDLLAQLSTRYADAITMCNTLRASRDEMIVRLTDRQIDERSSARRTDRSTEVGK